MTGEYFDLAFEEHICISIAFAVLGESPVRDMSEVPHKVAVGMLGIETTRRYQAFPPQ